MTVVGMAGKTHHRVVIRPSPEVDKGTIYVVSPGARFLARFLEKPTGEVWSMTPRLTAVITGIEEPDDKD